MNKERLELQKKFGITTPKKSEIKETLLGTGLVGYIKADYASIVELLGRGNGPTDKHKMDVQWVLYINGKILTIYNYANGKNYCGKAHGLALKDIDLWHIGGLDSVTQEKQILAKAIGGKIA